MKINPQGGNVPANPKRDEEKSIPNSPAKNIVEYTLAPLIEGGRNCLVCSDVEGMESVFLESVEFYFGGTPWQRTTRKSDDIFAVAENEIFKWPTLDRIAAARFRVRLKGERQGRPLIVRPSIPPGRTPDGERLIIDDWLMKRGFMKVQNDDAKSVE
jgi:hypothetical protein